VSVAAPPQPPTGAAPTPATEACPLCGAPLDPAQEWCLRCGAAARTRLAAPPNWKAPLWALALVVALSLGVLAAALVKLAGSSAPTARAPRTTTVTAPAAALPATTATTPGAGAPATSVPGTSTPSTSVPGTINPRPGVTGATPRLGATGIAPRTGGSAAPTLTSPRTGTAPAGRSGAARRVEEQLRKLGLLPNGRRSGK
jgi:hypothetical protein